MKMKKHISKGVYVVLDPEMNRVDLLKKLELISKEQIAAVQIWDNFKPENDYESLIVDICHLFQSQETPILLNNRWEWSKSLPVDGVHFDTMPENLAEIKSQLQADMLFGITCNNDLELVKQAGKRGFDYISFCSVFPSKTSNSCELVSFDTIRQAHEEIDIPVFLSGGITPATLEKLAGLPFSGVAVVSGVMSAPDPVEAIKTYNERLKL